MFHSTQPQKTYNEINRVNEHEKVAWVICKILMWRMKNGNHAFLSFVDLLLSVVGWSGQPSKILKFSLKWHTIWKLNLDYFRLNFGPHPLRTNRIYPVVSEHNIQWKLCEFWPLTSSSPSWRSKELSRSGHILSTYGRTDKLITISGCHHLMIFRQSCYYHEEICEGLGYETYTW